VAVNSLYIIIYFTTKLSCRLHTRIGLHYRGVFIY